MNITFLKEADLTAVTDLQPEGWPDVMPYIRFYTQSDFCFPLKATLENKIIGMGTAIVHNNVGWLGHIIVHPDSRGQGVGKQITEKLVELLHEKSCRTLCLVATELGEPVYLKIGFKKETEYAFFKNINVRNKNIHTQNILPINSDFAKQLPDIDYNVSGEKRMNHLEQHLDFGFVYHQNKKVEGFYLPTFGDGHITAITKTAGLELTKYRLMRFDNASFPVDNTTAMEFLYKNNNKEFRRASRMYLGEKLLWSPENIYNRVGGNLG
jgi:GNAT superfamily N-acetyltransferase